MMDNEMLGFADVDVKKLPKHKYTIEEMGRYYDMLVKPLKEMSKSELDFIEDIEKETVVFWQKAYGYSKKDAEEYVLNNRKRIIKEHKRS